MDSVATTRNAQAFPLSKRGEAARSCGDRGNLGGAIWSSCLHQAVAGDPRVRRPDTTGACALVSRRWMGSSSLIPLCETDVVACFCVGVRGEALSSASLLNEGYMLRSFEAYSNNNLRSYKHNMLVWGYKPSSVFPPRGGSCLMLGMPVPALVI